jgi:prolipoprotein diacylglyceryltransferase
MAWVYLRTPRPETGIWLSAGGWVLLASLLGARTAFVARNWSYFSTSLSEAWQVWAGGLDWVGASAGALAAIFLLAVFRRQNPGVVADRLLPLLLPLVVSTWLGCWQDGCAYGALSQTWWAVPAADEWGQVGRRVPVQLVGALLGMISLGTIDYLWQSFKRPGQAASLGALALGLQGMGLSFLRADPAQTWRGYRLESWLALGWVAVSVILCLAAFWPVSKKGA